MTISNDAIHEIASDWQHAIEASQESGVRPMLLVGLSDSLVDGLPALSACRRLAHTRTDLASPQVWAGGGSAWWSTALFQGVARTRTPDGKAGTPAISARFAGSDSATVIATLTMDESIRGADTAQEWLNGLPAGMVSYLQPQSTPGGIAPWASMPLTVMGGELDAEDASSIDWTAVAALILALCIVLLAMFL